MENVETERPLNPRPAPAPQQPPAQAPQPQAPPQPEAAPTEARAPQPQPQPPVATPTQSKEKIPLKDQFKKYRHIIIPVAVLVVIAVAYWTYGLFTTETTDDAYVTNHVHMISTRVNGTVISVPVNDNQIVKKGDVLVKLDPADFDVQVKIAQAADINAQNDLSRWKDHGFLHPNEVLQKSTDVAAALTADANLEKAQLQRKYTEVLAPEDGQVGNRNVETGQQLTAGQAIMAVVELVPWVVANFKEGQLAHIRPGQKVKVSVDAVPRHTFTGTVDSIAPGSGATFALLPPDNATGNFTKIVQRIPVKIIFDADSLKGYENLLAPGMSSEVTVYH
jgi:membrane fusion protein (multidrug efflux system)